MFSTSKFLQVKRDQRPPLVNDVTVGVNTITDTSAFLTWAHSGQPGYNIATHNIYKDGIFLTAVTGSTLVITGTAGATNSYYVITDYGLDGTIQSGTITVTFGTTAVGQGSTGFWTNVTAAYHFDGANGGVVFTDSKALNTLTRVGTVVTTTAAGYFKFGTSALSVPANSYLQQQ